MTTLDKTSQTLAAGFAGVALSTALAQSMMIGLVTLLITPHSVGEANQGR